MDSVQSSLRTFSLPILIALLYCLFTYNLLLDPVWTGWQLIGEVRLLIIGCGVVACFLFLLLECRKSLAYQKLIVGTLYIAPVLGLFILADDKWVLLEVFLILTWLPFMADGFRVLVSKFLLPLDWLQAGLLYFLLAAVCFLAFMMMGLINNEVVALFFIISIIVTIFGMKSGIVFLQQSVTKTGVNANFTIYYFTFLIALLSVVAVNSPQTYADTIAFRLPFLNDIKNSGGFPFHNYASFRVSSQLLLLAVYPFYHLFGEMGSATVFLFFAVLCFFSIKSFLGLFSTESKLVPVVLAFLFMSTPTTWILSTTMYIDLGMLAYLFAGLSFLVKENCFREQCSWNKLFIPACFLGAAYIIKVNAAIYVVLFVALYSVLPDLKIYYRNLLRLVTLVFVSILPWLIVSTVNTGNPLYPFFPSLFPFFIEVELFDPREIAFYNHSLSFRSLLSIPYDFTFATSRYGEYLDGIFGPSFVLLCFIAILFWHRSQHRISMLLKSVKPLLIVFCGVLITFFLVKLIWLRYLMPIHIFALIALGSFITKLNRSRKIALVVMSFCSLTFLSMFGVRLNYALDAGIGEKQFLGEISSKEFHAAQTQRIDEFINRTISENEKVISSGYNFITDINTAVFYASKKTNLTAIFEDLNRFEQFIDKNQIKYWVLAIDNEYDFLQGGEGLAISEKYLSQDRAVFGGGRFVVYDLMQINNEVKALALFDKLDDQNYKVRAFSDGESEIFKLVFSGISSVNNSNIIVDMNFFNSKGDSLKRDLQGKLAPLSRSSQLLFFTTPLETSSFTISIFPWRDIDGTYKVEKFDLSSYGEFPGNNSLD